MTKEERKELLQERREYLRMLASIVKINPFLYPEQRKPYEKMMERVEEIDKLLKEAQDARHGKETNPSI